jgi:alpha-L-fucosidase
MKKNTFISGALLTTWLLACGGAPVTVRAGETSPDPYAHETAAERDARMAWWREARFGMFIHWGVYAVPAGKYKGENIPSIGEWIMLRAKIPVAEYRAFAKDFNPVKYDPDAWVRLAKEAGMKYIVITAKHHDGFALYDSKVTDWDIAGATPYGKDLLKPLVAACKKHGLKIGFYYSQAQDWVHPGGAKARMEEGDGWDEAQKGDFDEYLQNIAYPQVEELLGGYDIDILWWDTPRWMTKERAERLQPLLKLRPGIITNNRLGPECEGDTDTPEQKIPATGIPGRDWETCMTMNKTWGYKSYDQNWKSPRTLIRNLVDIASKGGNYLLNVGPTAEGEIPEASIERLKAVGAWMKVNGESIYGTKASPFARLRWGRCTVKAHDGGSTLYLHVFNWPKNKVLRVPGLRNKVNSARVLGQDGDLEVRGKPNGVEVVLPEAPLDPIDTVVALEVEGPLVIKKGASRPAAGGRAKH